MERELRPGKERGGKGTGSGGGRVSGKAGKMDGIEVIRSFLGMTVYLTIVLHLLSISALSLKTCFACRLLQLRGFGGD